MTRWANQETPHKRADVRTCFTGPKMKLCGKVIQLSRDFNYFMEEGGGGCGGAVEAAAAGPEAEKSQRRKFICPLNSFIYQHDKRTVNKRRAPSEDRRAAGPPLSRGSMLTSLTGPL